MVVARATRGLEKLEHVGIWFCLTCDLCTDLCPAGVRFRDFVEAARRLAIEEGITEHGSFCCKCGAYLWPLHTVQYLKHMLGEASEELLTLCPRCRRHDFGNKLKALPPGSRRVYAEKRQVGED
jgi:Fe-S oxidoreductase